MSDSSRPLYNGRAKYDDTVARHYEDNRRASTHLEEMRLLDAIFKHIPHYHRVLDVPCGGGRASLHLAQQGYEVIAGDLSPAMRAIAQQTLHGQPKVPPVLALDLEHLQLPDRAVDTLLCFRLFHHFPDRATRERAVAEMCRVADRFVVLSYFSPWSVTSLKRHIRHRFGGRASQKHATPLWEIERYFERQGFYLRVDHARMPWVHTLHVALFERQNSLAH